MEAGTAASGDITLAAKDNVAQIVVADEKAAVHQAAEFLAGDIEKISGYKPAIVTAASPGKVNIRLVTLGQATIPAAIDTRGIQGQWESYRSSPRAETFGWSGRIRAARRSHRTHCRNVSASTPIYLWTGYRPEHRDPLILKRTGLRARPAHLQISRLLP